MNCENECDINFDEMTEEKPTSLVLSITVKPSATVLKENKGNIRGKNSAVHSF
jgi:hypothetical protein